MRTRPPLASRWRKALIETDADERARAVDALTTNHTAFFRENHHFEHSSSSANRVPRRWSRPPTRCARARRWPAAGGNPANLALIETDADERARAVDALTTNHTAFFRENHHFEAARTSWPAIVIISE
jgi:chemotaxis methyl-accepting protein methylase